LQPFLLESEGGDAADFVETDTEDDDNDTEDEEDDTDYYDRNICPSSSHTLLSFSCMAYWPQESPTLCNNTKV